LLLLSIQSLQNQLFLYSFLKNEKRSNYSFAIKTNGKIYLPKKEMLQKVYEGKALQKLP